MLSKLFAAKEKLAAVVAGTSIAAPVLTLAQSVGTPDLVPEQFNDFDNAIRSAFNIIIIIAGIIFVILFLIGGIQYLTAAGNEENSKKARQLILDAIIGLVIVVAAWAVGTYVLQLLGIRGADNGRLPTTIN
ncbi:hypothetical protein KC644_03125 [Candidatus Berkelbacteria bacterium]|nr:hypothetical protein [Candidatus Berkelbacteria bacterium]